MKININEIIAKVKFIEDKNLKAIITLNFGDFTIKGFRVQISQYSNDFGLNLWLVPPSYKDNAGRYHPIFFIEDKEIWKKLEQEIWKQYEDQNKNYYKKKFGLENDP